MITRWIDGKKYKMRDERPTKELRRLYQKFLDTYPGTTCTFHGWLTAFGKVHIETRRDRRSRRERIK